MEKLKTTYFCQHCSAQYSKWQGKCNACQEWNTIVEEVIQKQTPWQATDNGAGGLITNKPRQLTAIPYEEKGRILCKDQEFNRVLGGGIVQGSLVLIGGEPGIGKSTLLLQIALSLSDKKVLYVSGEESERQIKMRAARMEQKSKNCYILNETSIHNIFQQVTQLQPTVLIIDSIQTLHTTYVESAVGSIAQIRTCTTALIRYAKSTGTPVFLIGHITKEGTLAGPKVLEHMVDTVLQFEGDRHLTYRILRTIKNRFGSTAELGIYEMQGNGLREVANPSEILISQREDNLSGIAIGASLEGNRPLLIEIQALVSPATYGTPQRSATGFDVKRLNMLLAVLEKRASFRLAVQDIFLNIAGGLKVEDPTLDLAVCLAIVSSFKDVSIPQHSCFAAEVGLGGEVRGGNRIESRIAEAEKLGFQEIFISKYSQKGMHKRDFSINIKPFARLDEVIRHLL